MSKWRDEFNNVSLVNETQARRLCDQICTAHPDQPRLKTIAAVGAYDAEIGAPMEDSKRLTGVLSYLLRSGFLIDPDFEIDAVNFAQKRDFLNEDKKADLVFVSFILARHVRGTLVYDDRMNKYAETAYDYRALFGLALSTEHNIEKWRERIQSCDAKIIATYGGQYEIGTHNLCGDAEPWTTLIPTPKFPTPPHVTMNRSDKKQGGYEMKTNVSLEFLYNRAANDLPMPWLGFAANPDYLKAAALGLSPVTCLGQRARMFG